MDNQQDVLFSSELPDQRTTRKAKQVKTFYQATADNIINRALKLNDKTNATSWLEAANGIISNKTINYLISPLINEKTGNDIGKLPGEIRETDLINMVRERNLGEYAGLPYRYEVVVYNDDAVMMRDVRVRTEVNKIIQQTIINELNIIAQQQAQSGDQNGQQPIQLDANSKEVPEIQEKIKDVVEKYFDDRAIKGQNLLDLINDINDFDVKRLQAYFYWWACEEFYTYREIENNEVKTSIISPLDGYPIIGKEQYIEDGDGFVIKQKTTLTKIKNHYWDRLDQSEKSYLNSLVKQKSGSYTVSSVLLQSRSLSSSERNFYNTNSNKLFDVVNSDELIDDYTYIWRTEVPVTIKTTTSPIGEEYDEIVSDDYKPFNETETLRTEWIEEVWIGKRFGNATSGVYLPPAPCSVQRYDRFTNRPKLPVGGKKGLLLDIVQNPIPKRLITYELIDRLITNQIERTLAKFKSGLLVIPQGVLNEDKAGTPNEKMFYMKADDTLVYDETSIDLQTVLQGLRSINLPMVADHIRVLIDLKKMYREEGLSMANMNSYRLGDVEASTGKSVMQESIYRAQIGTVLSVTMFNAALERDHNADLEFAKVAYSNGKQSSFYSRNQHKTVFLNIDPAQLLESDLGVVVHNAKIDTSKMEAYRNYAFSAAQNGEFELAAAAIDADTLPEMKRAIKDIVDANKKLKADMEQQEQEATMNAADTNAKASEDLIQKDITIEKMRNDTDILIEQLKLSNTQSTTSGESSGTSPNNNNNDKILKEYNKTRDIDTKYLMHRDKMAIEEKKIKSNEKIAKENRNQYDTKK